MCEKSKSLKKCPKSDNYSTWTQTKHKLNPNLTWPEVNLNGLAFEFLMSLFGSSKVSILTQHILDITYTGKDYLRSIDNDVCKKIDLF